MIEEFRSRPLFWPTQFPSPRELESLSRGESVSPAYGAAVGAKPGPQYRSWRIRQSSLLLRHDNRLQHGEVPEYFGLRGGTRPDVPVTSACGCRKSPADDDSVKVLSCVSHFFPLHHSNARSGVVLPTVPAMEPASIDSMMPDTQAD
jgi:hypothetical protein